MEVDVRETGSILLATWFDIATYTTSDRKVNVIINRTSDLLGFDYLTGFTQLSPDKIVIVDSSNDCLKLLDRITNKLTKYAGLCGSSGFRDDTSEYARFNSPHSVSIDKRDEGYLIVSDTANNAIRRVSNTTPGNVTTLISNLPKGPRAMAWNHISNRTVYVICQCSLAVVDLNNAAVTDYPLSCGQHNSLIRLLDQVLLFPDTEDDTMIVYTTNGSTYSICSKSDSDEEDISSCHVASPTSILKINDQIYMGDGNGLKKLSGSVMTKNKNYC